MSFYPKCFDSVEQYREWRKSAITAKEFATPCMDCSAKYKSEVGARCEPVVVRDLCSVHRIEKIEQPGEDDDS